MRTFIKKALLILVLPVIGGIAAFIGIWYMPARNVQSEKPVILTAKEIFNAYNNSEKEANAKFLDKAVQLSGEIMETKTNQQGKTVCILKTDDPFFGVNCTFKENTALITGGNVVLKGICTGYITGADVVLIDCSIVPPAK